MNRNDTRDSMKIERRSYSAKPWRLIASDGGEVYAPQAFDHPSLGMTAYSGPVCGETKTECLERALALLERLMRVRPGATWTPAATPPDADITVMIALAGGEVWQGYFDGSLWIEVSGLQLAPGRVKYWMHTPAHPEDRA